MNVSKYLVSTASAVAVIGAISFAYAQTSPQTQNQGMTPAQSTPATPSTPGMRDQAPDTATGSMNNSSPGMSNSNRAGAAGTTATDTGNMANERTARADRN